MVARKKGKLSSSPTPLLPIGFSDSPLLLSHLRLSPKTGKNRAEKIRVEISHSDNYQMILPPFDPPYFPPFSNLNLEPPVSSVLTFWFTVHTFHRLGGIF